MRPGTTIADRFVLGELAGRGGMGKVFRAVDQSTGQAVAIKVLHKHEDGQVTRFVREARILAELDHPRVVRHIAHGTLPSGEPFLAMEWLEGADLETHLRQNRLSGADSLALALAVAEALAVLHDRGIVHRDLKPSNIFLVEGQVERVKLLDFGLARIADGTRVTNSGALLGTIAYMAPEQARGDQGLDSRADIFALGCVIYECFTGEQTFSAAHVTAALTKILFEESPRLRDRLPDVPAALDALVARMLAKARDLRPCDGREAADALRALRDTHLTELNTWPLATQPRNLPRNMIEGLGRVSAVPEHTRDVSTSSMLTDSEQRAMAVILLSAAEGDGPALAASKNAQLAGEALLHGGTLEDLVDGSAAVVLSRPQVATDLAAQAARCALALSRHAAGRRIAVAVGRQDPAGRLVMGSAIDRAARLLEGPLSANASGSASASADAGIGMGEDRPRSLITLDDSAVGLLGGRFDVRHDSDVFVLLGERRVAEVRTLLGKPSPYVGRELEMRHIEQLFTDALEDRTAQAVLVTAPAGMGKSRLAHEFLRQVMNKDKGRDDIAVWMARGDSLRAGSALGLIGQALRVALGVRGSEPIEVRREKIRAGVAQRVAAGEVVRVAEFLGEMIGTPFSDQDSLPLRAAREDAQLMNEQMRAAFIDFLVAACERGPVVILLDDLHWGDRSSVQFLDRALRAAKELPLFVLGLARPEVHDLFPGLWAERALQEIRLRALTRKAIERLARHVLGDAVSPDTVERLVQFSEGNAFYLEELIRWAAEGRSRALPETLVAMVQSRLAALGDHARLLLRAASIFGEVFWSGGVRALLGERIPSLPEELSALVEQELLVKRRESRFSGEEEYAFRHALLREGAYAMLTDEDRAVGHRLAGQWLEAQGEEDAVLLAEQFEKGGDGERAGRAYLRAVVQTSSAGDTAAAVLYAQRGLACRIPEELRIALLGVLCEAHLFQLNLVAEALPHAEELVRVAPRGSGPWMQGTFILLLGALQTGRAHEFSAALGALLTTAPASAEAAAPFGLALLVSVYVLDSLGSIAEAEVALETLAKAAREFQDRVPVVACYWHCSLGIRSAGVREDLAGAMYHGARATAIADAMRHRRYMEGGRVFESMNRWFIGELAQARQTLEAVQVSDEELALTSSLRPFVLAWLLADQGHLDDARAWAARLVASGQARLLPADEGRGQWALAEVLRRTGEYEAADHAIQTAVAMLGMASPLDMPGVLGTLAGLRLAEGRLEEALAAAEEGLAKYEAMGACSLFFRGAFLRLVHAECLAALGRREAACAAIARAREWILAHAEKLETPAQQRSFVESVPENRRTLALAAAWLGG